MDILFIVGRNYIQLITGNARGGRSTLSLSGVTIYFIPCTTMFLDNQVRSAIINATRFCNNAIGFSVYVGN